MGEFSIKMDRFSLDDLFVSRGESRGNWDFSNNGSIVRENPALVGYLMGQVAIERSELVAGISTVPILPETMDLFIEQAREEGARCDMFYVVNRPHIASMQIGRSVISHTRSVLCADEAAPAVADAYQTVKAAASAHQAKIIETKLKHEAAVQQLRQKLEVAR